jgi:hypothetical protein
MTEDTGKSVPELLENLEAGFDSCANTTRALQDEVQKSGPSQVDTGLLMRLATVLRQAQRILLQLLAKFRRSSA